MTNVVETHDGDSQSLVNTRVLTHNPEAFLLGDASNPSQPRKRKLWQNRSVTECNLGDGRCLLETVVYCIVVIVKRMINTKKKAPRRWIEHLTL